MVLVPGSTSTRSTSVRLQHVLNICFRGYGLWLWVMDLKGRWDMGHGMMRLAHHQFSKWGLTTECIQSSHGHVVRGPLCFWCTGTCNTDLDLTRGILKQWLDVGRLSECVWYRWTEWSSAAHPFIAMNMYVKNYEDCTIVHTSTPSTQYWITSYLVQSLVLL